MQVWMQISLMLCTFGFFRELRPSEPYVTEYLAGDWRNLTTEQVNKEVYPLGSYAVLAQLVIVFLITDLLRYKFVIITSAIAGITLFSILLWTETLLWLQVGQLFYGTFVACEVAYYTYIYAKVDRRHYQAVTGHTRAAILCGKFLGGVLAQILISTDSMDFRELHYISFATQLLALIIAFMLPAVAKSLYFYAPPEVQEQHINAGIDTADVGGSVWKIHEVTPKFSLRNAIRLICKHIKAAYTNPIVLQWSFWWALATCGQLQVLTYIQFLWKEVAPNHISELNGGIEAAATLFGAISAICAGCLNSNRRRTTNMIIICVLTGVLGALLFVASQTEYIWVAYCNYVAFCTIFFFILTIAASIIAANVIEDSFGLVFGINTLAAMLMQTILTMVAVTDLGFGLAPREQFFVYACYFFVLTVIFFFAVVIPVIIRKCKEKSRS